MPRFAMALVVDADDAEAAWNEVSGALAVIPRGQEQPVEVVYVGQPGEVSFAGSFDYATTMIRLTANDADGRRWHVAAIPERRET